MSLAHEISDSENKSRGQSEADRRPDRGAVTRSRTRREVNRGRHSLISRRCAQDVSDADEVVSRGHEGHQPVHLLRAPQLHLAQRADRFAPAKDFFDPLAQALADRVARMAGR